MGISRQQKGCLLHNGKTGKFRLAEIALRRHPSANIPQRDTPFAWPYMKNSDRRKGTKGNRDFPFITYGL